MTHYLLDANALLRYLRKDIPNQSQQILTLLSQARQSKVFVTVPAATILETVFVLSKYYDEPKEAIGSQLFEIVSSPVLDIEKREIVKRALIIWKTENVSFVDCLILAQAQEEGKVLFTFDKKLAKLAKRA